MERLAGRFILLWGWRRALTAFLAGALAILGQAPYDFFAVYFVSFSILVWLLDGAVVEPPARLLKRLRPAFAIGWWFGFGYFVAGLWWIGSAMLVEGDDFIWAIPIAVLVLPAILAVFYGLACALARMVWTDDIGRIVSLAAAFGLFEWLRTFVLTGFPWNPVGYAAMPIPLFMQSVSVVGIVGMNILTVFVSAMPALFAGRRNVRFGVVFAVLLLVAHGAFGAFVLSKPEDSSARSIAVRIVQPAVNQAEKFDRDVRAEIFQGLLDLSKQPPEAGKQKPQLIVWPETSVPFLFTEHPEALTALGDNLDAGQMLVAGIVRAEGKPGEPDSRYYNSVVVINDRGEIVDAVDKVHLVPGGEYLPLSDLLRPLGIDSIVQMQTTFTPGTQRHPVRVGEGISAALFICYEAIFPDLVSSAVKATSLIINVTNDAWFGDTTGPYQHFRQTQLRAVETGLPLVRAANTGISAYIDPKGRVVDALAVNTRGVIDVAVKIPGAAAVRLAGPRINGLMILLLFMLVGGGFYVRQRLRSN